MQLTNYYQVKTSQGNPSTSRAPSMAAGPGRLFITYIGEGGANVWWVQTPSPQDDSLWTRNEQVKINRTLPLTSKANPAMVVFQGVPGILAVDSSGTFLNVCWFDGAEWQMERPKLRSIWSLPGADL
jgi:hypothetical protein